MFGGSLEIGVFYPTEGKVGLLKLEALNWPGRFIDVLERRQVRQVFAGYDYSCVISNTERLFAAGGATGQRKPHAGVFRRVRVYPAHRRQWRTRPHRTAISWGRNNEFGQVGHGPSGALRRQRPGAVRGLPQMYRVLAVACGESSSLALLSSGEIYAWGSNDLGQLGLGDTEPRSEPAKIGGSAVGVPFRGIAAGFQHCLAVSRSGHVYAWGNSRHGRLGLGNVDEDDGKHCECSPKLVPDLPIAKHVSGGGSHSAILAPKGKLLMCGSNRHGQLGLPRTKKSALVQRYVFSEVAHVSQGVRLVECGNQHTLCLTFDGTVVGFGSNSEGQLGIGRISDCEERPVPAMLRQGADTKKLLVFALAVTMDHSCVLALPAPERRDQLDRYVSEGSCLPRSSVHSAGGRLEFSPVERTSSVGGLGRLSLCCGHSSPSVDHDDDEGADGGLARTVSLPAHAVPRLSTKRSQPIPPIQEDEETAEGIEDAELPATLSQGLGTLPRNNSYVKFRMPTEDGSPTSTKSEVVLLKPLVQPGVASKAFVALSPGDLLEMIRDARRTEQWRETTRALCATLRCPSETWLKTVLNSSFHFQGSPRPFLDSEVLHTALELLMDAAPVEVHDAVLDAAASGLDLLTAPEDGGNAGANVGVECRYSSNEVHAASYVPVVAFSFCPPQGIFFELGIYFLDMVNDIVQITTFLLHGDWWFAGFMSFFVLLSLYITVQIMSELSKLERCDPVGEARLSLARRVPTEAWEGMLRMERNVEAPSTGLIGPYGAALLQLTPLQAASCLYGLLSSANAMAQGRLQGEVKAGAVASAYALKAIRPMKATALFAWYLGAFTAELAAFAVASATLHPIVIVPGYMLGAVANTAAAWWGGSEDFLFVAARSCITVSVAMAGNHTKSFLRNNSSRERGPGFIPAASILLRFITWAALCFLDLPQGLVPFGSLGRPMGLPANATSMFLTEEVGFGACSWPATGELNSASTIFNTCLLLLAMVLVPIHMCIVVGMLLFNPIYACAADNLPLKEEVEAKQREIDAFATQNEEMNGECTELCLLSEWDSNSDSD
eukprot:s3092_g3.t1